MIQVGSQNTQKTKYCKKSITETNKKRVFVIDIKNEYDGVETINTIELDSFLENRYSVGVFRYVVNDINEGRLDILKILSGYWNGLLIIENPSYIFKKMPIQLFGLFATNRTKSVDIIINFISFKKCANLIIHADFLHLYKTIDSLSELKNRLSMFYGLISEANAFIDENNSVIIDLNENKIHKITNS